MDHTAFYIRHFDIESTSEFTHRRWSLSQLKGQQMARVQWGRFVSTMLLRVPFAL